MAPTLVVLAAGLGSRFGGDKQLAGLGPGGRPLLAYALHDAARAGFARAVLVIREGLEAPLRAALPDPALPFDCVIQEPRAGKPWGTGHAVLAAAPLVDQPFMVVNADDFYGAESYRAMAHFLGGDHDPHPPTFAIGAFPLGATLSAHGPVNRGICRFDAEGWLAAIEEVSGLRMEDSAWPADTPVSMNCWGFTPMAMSLLDKRFRAFRAAPDRAPDAEFMLPEAVGAMVAAGEVRVRHVPVPGPWLGVTYPADRDPVAAALEELGRSGEYPRWT